MLSTLDAARQQIPDSKLMPRSIYDVLTQSSNDLQRSLCRVHCRHGVRVSSLGIENGNLRHCALHCGYTIQITRGKNYYLH